MSPIGKLTREEEKMLISRASTQLQISLLEDRILWSRFVENVLSLYIHSDGSISYHQNLDDLTINLSEDASSGQSSSAFSKLKVKMSSLALPAMPSQQARRQAQEEMAADNRLKSQLQYRHLSTKVILL